MREAWRPLGSSADWVPSQPATANNTAIGNRNRQIVILNRYSGEGSGFTLGGQILRRVRLRMTESARVMTLYLSRHLRALGKHRLHRLSARPRVLWLAGVHVVAASGGGLLAGQTAHAPHV